MSTQTPPHKGGGAPSPIFGPFLLWPNGWMHQDAIRGFGLDGDPACPPKREAEAGGRARNFRPMAIVAEWLDGSRCMTLGMEVGPHCARWGHSSPPQNREQSPSKFSVHLYCGQTAGCIMMPLNWYGGRLGICDIVFDVDPATPEKGHTHSTQFLAHVYCGQMAGWMKTPLGTEVDLGPGHIVLHGVPAPAKGAQQPPPLFLAHVYCGHGRPSQPLLNSF